MRFPPGIRTRKMTGRGSALAELEANEPDESSYMLQNKRPSHRTCRIAAPDGDWGWYVVGGCAFANFLLPGMLRSFVPDVLDEFLEIHEFGNSGFVSRWIPAMFDLMFSIAGSLSCLLCELTSHRAVTLWGGLLASVGMMSSSFANSIPYLHISYGIMVGFGAGLCYPAGILIVNEYFNEHRGLANGLSLVGTTIGSFALPPYLTFLTSSYGYRGGILIVSGMMLNVLACALTYVPVDEHVRFVETLTKISVSSSAASITSINASEAINTADEYYAAVVSSPSEQSANAAVPPKGLMSAARRWLFGTKPAAEFLAVSIVNVVGHLAYAVFAATTKPPTLYTVILQLAAANAAGRVLVPVASDLLSSGGGGGSASVYLYAVVMAMGGVVMLTAAPALSDGPTSYSKLISPSLGLLALFSLLSGAAVGLEPLVAIRVLGHERLAASYSATLLGKGAAQLVVDLLITSSDQQQISKNAVVSLYTLGFALMVAATSWTAAFLAKRHYSTKNRCNRYVRTA